MKINSSKQLGAVAGLVITILAIIALSISFEVNEEWKFITYIGISILLGILTFFIVAVLVDRLVIDKIKVIYRIIFSKNSDQINSRPPLEMVQKQAESWANTRRAEITSLKQQAAFRREFVGNLAHELRTPLFSIQGYIDTLLEGGLEDPKINYDYLARADKNLERLTVLVKDLSAIVDLETDEESLVLDKVNIVDLALEVYSLLELRAKKKGVKLKFAKSYDKPILVKANKDKLLQVFTNLVMNAIYYSNKDGHCTITFSDTPNHILVEVKDNGIGIEAVHLPRLFERFYRVDKSRSRHEGGTGLGLAICKHIIESHGQTINVRSIPGEGTTFSFTLEKAK
jgi:two-component system phosphate regulon sensor histidine kinase PhoR